MKNAKKMYAPINYLVLLFLGGMMLAGCEFENVDEREENPNIEALTDIEGEYNCTGECITVNDGVKAIVTVSGENDVIERYPGAKENLYQVNITAKGFHELELGALTGRTLNTATAAVSDSTYPVIEEYVFNTDESGKVIGFTKTVRNPDPQNFKACVVYGTKVNK